MLFRLHRTDTPQSEHWPHTHVAGRSVRRARVLIGFIALFAMLAVPFQGDATTQIVGPKAYYLALGDSLAFGYQPNFDWNHGYSDQWFTDLRTHGVLFMANYACPGETSTTFIWGGCSHWYLQRTPHTGPQLSAAVNFITNHRGRVSPISLDIGANDVLGAIDPSTCAVDLSAFNNDLAVLDFNLNQIILPQLTNALKVAGRPSGDLVLMLYYNPYQNQCPGSVVYLNMLNQHLAASAASFGLRTADAFLAFSSGGTLPNTNICSFTWMCAKNDIHATGGRWDEPGNGYGAIAGAFMDAVGY